MDKFEWICSVISWILMGISITLLGETSITYSEKWKAWVPLVNLYTYCKIISDKNNKELEKKLLITYGITFGSLLLAILATGSLLALLLMICFSLSTIAMSVIVLIANYYLIDNVIPYAKVIFAVCLICDFAGYFVTFLDLVQPIVILICSAILLYRYNNDEQVIAEKKMNEQKYREDLEREKYLIK